MKTPKQLLGERQKRWRNHWASIALFLMCFAGVILSQFLPDLTVTDRVIDATFQPLRPAQVIGSVLFSVFIFAVLERSGDLVGKKKNWKRLATKAFMMGFLFNDVLGRISW